MTFSKISDLIKKPLSSKNIKQKADASRVCFIFDEYVKEKFPDFSTKAIFFKENTLYFSSQSNLESQEVMLQSSEILLYLNKNLDNVNEIKLKIVSPRA